MLHAMAKSILNLREPRQVFLALFASTVFRHVFLAIMVGDPPQSILARLGEKFDGISKRILL
jgi:hypothetical protein